MPSENVENLRAVYADWARGDFRAGQNLLAPEVTFVTFTSDGDELTFHGPAEVGLWMRDFLQTWIDLRVEAQEFLERGNRVLAVCHQRATGRQSGVEVEMPVYAVWTFQGEKVLQLHWSRDRDKAFQAAGLAPAP